MEMQLNPTALAKFLAFEVKNTIAIKGGDGEDAGDGILGSTDIADV